MNPVEAIGHGEAAKPPRVFVSYAHESPEHQETVRDLWVLLRSQGIDARLDSPAAERRQDWPVWMLREVREADFVLVIASPAYRRRAEGLADVDEGRGVQFEAALIREQLYADRQGGMGKFLPVLLPGASPQDIPIFLGPVTATSYAVREMTPAGIELLLRVLTDQPFELEPPLGATPVLAPRPLMAVVDDPASALEHEVVLDVVCERGRVRCRTTMAGSLLGQHEAAMPYGMADVWNAMSAGPIDAAGRLTAAGQRLGVALLDEATAGHLTELLDRSPLGTVVDVVVEVEGEALDLPYELLRLRDGRLLATIPGVRMRRRVRGLDRRATVALAGPLKILVAVAAPEETATTNPPLDVEAAMQAILDATARVDASGAAQVRILEVASPQQIAEALRDAQYHVLHISAHGSQTGLELEDEDGNAVSVAAADLVVRLRSGGKPLPLIVLSSCAGGSGGSDGLAATLVRCGADRVIAMQTSVSDVYATRLTGELYEHLARPDAPSVAAALADARRELEDAANAAAHASAPWPPEHAVATLLCVEADPPLVDAAAEPIVLPQRTEPPVGGGVRRLPIGYLIGRRAQLRTALMALRGGPVADQRYGALSGVLLTGVGGIGKSAVAGRIETRLAGEGWLAAVHFGRWNPSVLIAAVVDALTRSAGISADRRLADAHALLASSEVEDTAKLDCVCALLSQVRLLVLFDDFEQNLKVGGNAIAFKDPGFEELFERLCQASDVGRLLVTSRYPPPEAEAYLYRIDIPPLSRAELRRLLLRLPAIGQLDPTERQVLVDTIGGHPRLLEFVNALLRGGRANLKAVTIKLRSLAGSDVAVAKPRPLTQALRDASLLGSRDILLAELIALLSAEEREVLLQAAVSRIAQTLHDLATARAGAPPTAEQQTTVTHAAERLIDLTLLSVAGDREVVVHPWIAEALSGHQGEDASVRHQRAITMRIARFEAGTGAFADLIEICHHYASSERFTELSDFGQAAVAAIETQLGELSVATFLGEIVPMIPTATAGFLMLADRERQALLNTGSVSAATQRADAILRTVRHRAQADPSNAQAQRDLSVSYDRLGDLMRQLGDGAQAERFYRDGLAIAERLAQADPATPRRNATCLSPTRGWAT